MIRSQVPLVLLALLILSACSTPNSDRAVTKGVEAQVREKEVNIRACYESEYGKRKPKPKGYVLVRMKITEWGDVQAVETLEDSFKNPRLVNCLHFVLKAIRFDRAGITMETFAQYPFIFDPPEPDDDE